MAGHSDDPVAMFQALTGCADAAQARQYVANAEGDVHLAAAMYSSMEGGAGGGSGGGDHSDFASSVVQQAQEQAEEGAAYSTTIDTRQTSPISLFIPRHRASPLLTWAGAGDDEASGTVTITLWKNGFQVEEGDLRSYDDPANREFMDSVRSGRVPRELQSRGTNLDVHLDDKSSETFKEPVKPRVLSTAAWGSAAAPSPGSHPPAAAAAAGATASTRTSDPVDRVKDPGAPTTTLLLQMVDGRKVKATFNTNATVGVLREAMASVDGTPRSFRMQTHKGAMLDDDSCTLESLGLRRAKISQIVD